jgi:hypothetical protein
VELELALAANTMANKQPFFAPVPSRAAAKPLTKIYKEMAKRFCSDLKRSRPYVDAEAEQPTDNRLAIYIWPKYRATNRMQLASFWWDGSHIRSLGTRGEAPPLDATAFEVKLRELAQNAELASTLEEFKESYSSPVQGTLRLENNPGKPSPGDVLVIVSSTELERLAKSKAHRGNVSLSVQLPEPEPLGKYDPKGTYTYLAVETYAANIYSHHMPVPAPQGQLVELQVERVKLVGWD